MRTVRGAVRASDIRPASAGHGQDTAGDPTRGHGPGGLARSVWWRGSCPASPRRCGSRPWGLVRLPCFRGLSPSGRGALPCFHPCPCARAAVLYSAGWCAPQVEFEAPLWPSHFSRTLGTQRFNLTKPRPDVYASLRPAHSLTPPSGALSVGFTSEDSLASATRAMRPRPLTATGRSPYGSMDSSRHHAEVVDVDRIADERLLDKWWHGRHHQPCPGRFGTSNGNSRVRASCGRRPKGPTASGGTRRVPC